MTQRLFSALLLFSAILVTATSAHADKDAVQFGDNISGSRGPVRTRRGLLLLQR